MKATVIKFPGNRRPVTRDLAEPCIVIILPVVAVDRGRVFDRALKRYTRKRKQPKVPA